MDTGCTVVCCVDGVLDQWSHACIGGQVVTLGDPGIAGLGFRFAGDDPGAGVFRRGVNGMAYIDPPVFCPWVGFSDSQAEQVKRVLRSDIRIDRADYFAEAALGYTAKRHLLGDYRSRSGFDPLDFDGDGRRDIAVWQPPGTAGAPTPGVGRFRVLTSSSGYASLIEKDLGRRGDVPVPGYYDDDSKTDFAVLRRGGLTTETPLDSQFWWLWCKSSQGHSCTPLGQRDWGYQYDVPLPNVNFDGLSGTDEVAVYRPSTQYVYWKRTTASTWNQIDARPLASQVVHMHGLFDTDWKTDLVFYEPSLARYQMLLSSNGWSNGQVITRTFDSVLRPDAIAATDAGAGAPALRHGGVPLPAQWFNWGIFSNRRALRVWDAHTGNWHTMWTPTTSSAVQTCQWGSPRDIPLAGPIDRDGDLQTDLAVFRPTGNGPAIFQRAGSGCGVYANPIYPTGASPKSIVLAVTDMNGDAKGDFLFLDPDKYEWNPWYSQPNGTYVSGGVIQLGGPGGMAL